MKKEDADFASRKCVGESWSCSRTTHTSEYCPRNPRSPRADPKQLGQTGPHYSLLPDFKGFPDRDRPERKVSAVSAAARKVKLVGIALEGRIQGHSYRKILPDTGSEVSLIAKELFDQAGGGKIRPYRHPLIVADNHKVDSLGYCRMPLTLTQRSSGRTFTRFIKFVIMEELNSGVILGMDALTTFFSAINLDNATLEFKPSLDADDEFNPPSLPPNQSYISVSHGVSIPARHGAWVQVYFDSKITRDNLDVPIVCEPSPVYNRNRSLVNIQFPSHVIDS